MKIAPMALLEIFSAGEIIEQNKMIAMDPASLKLSNYDTELGRHFPYGDLRKGDVAGGDAFFFFLPYQHPHTGA